MRSMCAPIAAMFVNIHFGSEVSGSGDLLCEVDPPRTSTGTSRDSSHGARAVPQTRIAPSNAEGGRRGLGHR